jgi:hypothetical protein
MKTILTLLIVGTLCLTSRAGTNAMLCGIRIVETQDKPCPPRGKLGERGSYQFRRSTWRMHTNSSFDLAENREVANAVAKRHYAWIEAQLKANGLNPSPYNVALAWNAGVNAVIRGNAPAVAHDYATRVLNIASTIPDYKAPEPKPKPAWRAPVLVMDEAPVTAATSPATASAQPVATASAVSNVPSTEANDLIEVRYHSNPIMLAFNRSSPAQPAKETPPAPVEVVANTPVIAEIPQMQMAALVENVMPGVSTISWPAPRG